ncbi:MAG: GNAT family N-acetyltransferase [Candidatus Polarisedimenticolia bacterium]
MTLAFRKAAPGDDALLTSIARAAKAGWGYPAEWLRVWEASLEISAAYIERGIVRIAVHDGEAVGFYALVRRDAGWLLDHFWVMPASQGQGVGRAMFEHAMENVRALGPDGVVVIEADPNAAGFYERMGARER